MAQHEGDEPRYAISVVAEIVASHPQTLRMYERCGLITPRRTAHNVRLYSEHDVERIRQIQSFTSLGVNLAGIEIIFRLLDQIERLEHQLGRHQSALRRGLEEQLTEELRARLREEGNA